MASYTGDFRLPFLPGNTFNTRLARSVVDENNHVTAVLDPKFHKSHAFDYSNKVAVFDECKPGIGGEPLLNQDRAKKTSFYPAAEGGDTVPAWVAFDRQVLRFESYFEEAVTEKREEQFRIRRCLVYFYLEDDTVQVVEPRQKNSGIPQGTLIRRHRVPLPEPDNDRFYTVEHFNIGKELTLYGRIFRLVDADQFTKNFLHKLGVKLGEPESVPSDPYSEHRAQQLATMKPRRPYERVDTLRQFLDNDRRVLRFYCCWDDSANIFGDARDMVLHYFLADDTIEIRENVGQNSGRDHTPSFLRRQKLPRAFNGPQGPGGKADDCYTDRDLAIGAVITVYGRRFLLCDCDDATKDFYRQRYGVSDFTPIAYKADAAPAAPRTFPPYNGFGSEEDSLGSCISLIPKPPKRDFNKMMSKDTMVLRYAARLRSAKHVDAERRFIISFFLGDDTIAVWEPQQRNSGIMGGRFMERRQVKREGSDAYLAATDFYVGAVVNLNKHEFVLFDADEYALNYMEEHADEFPFSNLHAIEQKLIGSSRSQSAAGDARAAFEAIDAQGRGHVTQQEFKDGLVRAGFALAEQERLTLARFFDRNRDNRCDYGEFIARVSSYSK